MLIELWSDSYAPGMIQGRIVNARKLAKVVAHLKAQGQGQEDTFLLSPEDCEAIFGEVITRNARDGGITVRHDDFEVLTLYGWDCNTLKL